MRGLRLYPAPIRYEGFRHDALFFGIDFCWWACLRSAGFGASPEDADQPRRPDGQEPWLDRIGSSDAGGGFRAFHSAGDRARDAAERTGASHNRCTETGCSSDGDCRFRAAAYRGFPAPGFRLAAARRPRPAEHGSRRATSSDRCA